MYRDKNGYWIIKVDGRNQKYHRYVWMQANGPIPEGYDIHHRNGIKDDNRIENLELIQRGRHMSLHHKGKAISDEQRKAVSEKMKGQQKSDSHKSLIADGHHKGGLRSNNTSGYKGVTQRKNGKWHSQIQVHDKRLHLGDFHTPEEAALAYDKKARELWGDDAFQNFSQR